jgi:methenyltetrahydromethanopterin cyclohydrolase
LDGDALSKRKISVNHSSLQLVEKLCSHAEYLNVSVERTDLGTTLIDAGIDSTGGFLAGQVITEVCMGGLGSTEIFPAQYDDLALPSIFVHTDHPAISTLGSQFAGWQVKAGKYLAIGSGPARALALKPEELYERIEYEDECDKAVLVLETSKKPSAQVIQQVSDQCKIEPSGLTLILVPTTSVAGSTQISGRIVETGLHKLMKLGLDPKLVEHAWGYAPIMPPHPRFDEAMGRTNDAIMYAGTSHYSACYENDDDLSKLVNECPSSASRAVKEARKRSGRSPRFLEIFKDAGFDFYRVDPNLFAPAVVTVTNVRSGKIHRAGRLDVDVLRGSLGIS